MKLPRDLVAPLTAFGDAGVRYMVVGGHAVGVHARPRTTKDLDLWLEGGAKNIARACTALRAFGVPPTLVEQLRRTSPNDIVWMGRPPARIDLLLTLPGVKFESAWARRVDVALDGLSIPVIGRDNLIANKRAVSRPQDRRDVRAIERAVAQPRRSKGGKTRGCRPPSATAKGEPAGSSAFGRRSWGWLKGGIA